MPFLLAITEPYRRPEAAVLITHARHMAVASNRSRGVTGGSWTQYARILEIASQHKVRFAPSTTFPEFSAHTN
jgi:hypothetical protein